MMLCQRLRTSHPPGWAGVAWARVRPPARLENRHRGCARIAWNGQVQRQARRAGRLPAAGVNIEAQDEGLRAVKELARSTFTPACCPRSAASAASSAPISRAWTEPVLVASADGVGTKLTVARMAGDYTTVGARPGQPLRQRHPRAGRASRCSSSTTSARACSSRRRWSQLVARRRARLPRERLRAARRRDRRDARLLPARRLRPRRASSSASSTARSVLDGARVAAGDVLLGLPSAGLHTNGYSLARRILFDELGLRLDDRAARPRRSCTVGEALLAPHRSYLAAARAAARRAGRCTALAHITGGGLTDNLPRVLPDGLAAEIRARQLGDSGAFPPAAGQGRRRARGDVPGVQHGDRHGRPRRLRTPVPSSRGASRGRTAGVADRPRRPRSDGRGLRSRPRPSSSRDSRERGRSARAARAGAHRRPALRAGEQLRRARAGSRRGEAPAEIVLVASNVADAPGLARARELGIPTVACPHARVRVARRARERRPRGAARGRCRVGLPRRLHAAAQRRSSSPPYAERILNIHPSLLPAFPGLAPAAPGARGRGEDLRLHGALRRRRTRQRADRRAARGAGRGRRRRSGARGAHPGRRAPGLRRGAAATAHGALAGRWQEVALRGVGRICRIGAWRGLASGLQRIGGS